MTAEIAELNFYDEVNAVPEIEPPIMNKMTKDERIVDLIRVRRQLFRIVDSLESDRRKQAKDEFHDRHPLTLTAERLDEVLESKMFRLSKEVFDLPRYSNAAV